jgi:hypothetical protein
MVRHATAARFNAGLYIFTLVINGEVPDLRAQSRYLTADLQITPKHNSTFSGHNF